MIIGYYDGQDRTSNLKANFICRMDSNIHLCLSVCESNRKKELGEGKGEIVWWMDRVGGIEWREKDKEY